MISKGAFHLSDLTCQSITITMRISLLIKIIQPDQSILKTMHQGDAFSTKTNG